MIVTMPTSKHYSLTTQFDLSYVLLGQFYSTESQLLLSIVGLEICEGILKFRLKNLPS